MPVKLLVAMAGLTALWADHARAAVPVEAVAEGRWTVDFAEDRCVALRKYKAGGREMILGLQPGLTGDSLALLLRLSPDEALESVLRPGFRPGTLMVNGQRMATEYFQVQTAAKGGLLVSGGYRLADKGASPLERLTKVEMRTEGLAVTLPLSGTERLSSVLATCNAGLLEAMGFSRADQERLASWPKPRANLVSYVTPGDYPSEAVRRREQGLVQYRLLVGTNGRVESCTIRASSGSALLDQHTCALMQRRAAFAPARDKAGKPMAAPIFSQVRWVLPQQ